ncbi:PepSY domain-containing protein [Filifactor villosus]|uniref:PepSY domain-containing protein n=1 Tax=Filifactor villosus TaxID=29374 RepID=A0ABV9QNR9_9FIRM
MKAQKSKKHYLVKGLALALGLNLTSGSMIVSAAPTNNNIGLEKAKSIALKDARVHPSNAFFVKAALDYENGKMVYDIEFYHKNKEYDYEIDAATGKILEKDNDIDNFVIPSPADIGVDKAKNIALKDARLSASQVKFVKAKAEMEDGKKVYDIEFYHKNKEYDYEIDAATGRILEKDTDIEGFEIPAPADIGVDKAKNIALRDAGLSASQVQFVKAQAEMEDGKKVYDIEFYHKNKEYDYEIDAATGRILEKDTDIEGFEIPAPADIGLNKAKEIALRDAGLSASQVQFIKAQAEMEDGKKVYDIEFYHNNVEYDYEIDAATGRILEKDTDIEGFEIPAPADIGVDKAKNIALKDARLSASQVKFVKAKAEMEDGKKVYDIEFYHKNKEYDYEIDAATGRILEKDTDIEDFEIPAPAPADIGLEAAKNIALNAAGLNASQVYFTKAQADFEDGTKVYDIEFYHNNVEYSLEIEASSGNILEYDVDIDDDYDNGHNDDDDDDDDDDDED